MQRAALALALACACTPDPPKSSVRFLPCVLGDAAQPRRLHAECATIDVPFRAGEPRTIAIAIARIATTGGTPAPDPIVIIPGGPGQSASGSFLALQGAFMEANAKRDVILVDPRGTGRSHPLDCNSLTRAEYMQRAAASDVPPLALLRTCAKDMSDDPAAFDTAANVRDLEAVRGALAVERWNLYGVSYGTRVALAYTKAHDAHVRAMVLDGVVAPQTIVGRDSDEDADRALRLLGERCRAQPKCGEAVGDLEAALTKLHARLAKPENARFPHPRTGTLTTARFSASTLVGLARFSLYVPELLAPLPWLVKTALASGDVGPLAALAQIQRDGALLAINPWVNLATLCREDARAEPEPPNARTPGFFVDHREPPLYEVCAAFVAPDPQTRVHEPVASAVPTLLMSGEADPVTPPAGAELAMKTLAKSKHVVVKGQGHNVIARGCLPHLAAKLFETADAAALDTACVADIAPFPLFTEGAGP